MANLRYYEDERARWAQLSMPMTWRAGRPYAHGRMGEAEATTGIRRLAAKFGLPLTRRPAAKFGLPPQRVEITFTHGRRHSCAGYHEININTDWSDWLVVAHEVAHTYYRRKYAFETRQGHNHHGRAHARIVDRFCAWIVEQGWHLGALAHEVALAEIEQARQHLQRERVAACPPPIEARIAHRQEQVRRLERKIKALTTRLKSARRSMGALERVKAKQEAGR